jgi:hypothetical protein
LATLESQVREAKYNLQKARNRSRQVQFIYLVVTGLIYACQWGLAWLDMRLNYNIARHIGLWPWRDFAMVYLVRGRLLTSSEQAALNSTLWLCLLFGGVPFCVYLGKRLLSIYFARMIGNAEERMRMLISEQKEKLEELKKRTKFYLMKDLVARYEKAATPTRPDTTRKRSSDEQQPLSPISARSYHGQSAPPDTSRLELKEFANLKGNSSSANAPRNTMNPATAPNAANFQAVAAKQTSIEPSSMNYPMLANLHSSRSTKPPEVQPALSPPALSTAMAGKSWLDRLMDLVLGESTSATQSLSSSSASLLPFALICRHCGAHNGFVPLRDYQLLIYQCPRCAFWHKPPQEAQLEQLMALQASQSSANKIFQLEKRIEKEKYDEAPLHSLAEQQPHEEQSEEEQLDHDSLIHLCERLEEAPGPPTSATTAQCLQDENDMQLQPQEVNPLFSIKNSDSQERINSFLQTAPSSESPTKRSTPKKKKHHK